MTVRNLYQVLGVARDASPEGIRQAYSRLAKRHHPDSSGVLPERLVQVRQAYRCLSDPEARARHDRALARDEHLHLAGQRIVRRRLSRFDHRHPQHPPRPYWRRRWRSMLVVVAGLAVVGYLSVTLLG